MPPSAPPYITGMWPDGKRKLTITGVSTSGVNGDVIYSGLIAGSHSWSSDGTQTAGASNTIVEYTAGAWKISRGASYSATKTSAATDPVGLTTWTIGTGTGSPTVAAATLAAPPSVHSAPSNSPQTPPVITT